MRVLLYAHDGRGLGHAKKISLIANQLKQEGIENVLCLSGEDCLGFFLDKHVEYIKLPSYESRIAGNGGSLTACKRLAIGVDELIRMRAKIVSQVAKYYKPDVVIVDYLPCGKKRELKAVIPLLPEKCKVVLGMRAVVGNASFLGSEYLKELDKKFLLKYYDFILHYADPDIFSLQELPFFATLAKKIIPTGFVVKKVDPHMPSIGKNVLVTLGSGNNSLPLIGKIIQAVSGIGVPVTIVAGPNLGQDAFFKLRNKFKGINELVFHRFSDDMDVLYRRASVVVAAAGYNTIMEVLQYNHLYKIFIARNQAVGEQELNVKRLSEFFKFSYMSEQRLSIKQLRSLLQEGIHSSCAHSNDLSRYKFDGLNTVTSFIKQLSNGEKIQAYDRKAAF